MNEEKRSVGRPKLADKKLKKESIIVSIIVLVIMMIVGFLAFNILTVSYNPKYMVGTVYSSHVNSCVIENDQISCGPNVIYMKYKTDDNEYVEMNRKDKNISTKLSVYNNLTVCYKTDTSGLTCDNY